MKEARRTRREKGTKRIIGGGGGGDLGGGGFEALGHGVASPVLNVDVGGADEHGFEFARRHELFEHAAWHELLKAVAYLQPPCNRRARQMMMLCMHVGVSVCECVRASTCVRASARPRYIGRAVHSTL